MEPERPKWQEQPAGSDGPLTWDDSYAIALELMSQYPGVNLDEVSLNMIYEWTIELASFEDDKELVNENILMNIYTEWYEAHTG